MRFLIIPLLTVLATAYCLAATMHEITQDEIDLIVKSHNQHRAKVAAGRVPGQPAGVLEPLVWDDEVAQHAYNYMSNDVDGHGSCPTWHNPDKCLYHENTVDSLGENLAWGSDDLEEAIDLWVKEHKNYTYSRAPNGAKHSGAMIGHYTQVVWARTKRVGCAIANKCYKNGHTYEMMLLCNYLPAGNMNGEFPYYVTDPPSVADGTMDSCQYEEYKRKNYDPWKKILFKRP
uniref:SCP domain-containing protein n=1 Tax=Romanomermis culicivorax TaxID=13658 RepID=A0A915LCM0_ROMCU